VKQSDDRTVRSLALAAESISCLQRMSGNGNAIAAFERIAEDLLWTASAAMKRSFV